MSPKLAFDALLHAVNTQDATSLETLLSDSFRFTGTQAQHQNKSQRVAHILENPVFKSLRLRNVEFEMLETTCLVFAEFQYEGAAQSTLWFGRSTFVFVRQADAWKLVAQHNSHVQEGS
ncbi:MAG: nuclear transport factor 2 family protein [Pleurocapsa sp. SU_196_0]|nr:nuclear transport factor 2 family protein [Pleurocapsa sp. SU_196_0]